ncbi:MAG: TonB-dependent receptor, partial [Pseudomonadota bacterium]|nr:TonB-dependent receptor [Pseudomonadota bacterium]
FEDGTPKTKVVGGLDWTLGDWAVSAKATYYASVLVANNASTLDYETGDHTLFDLEARYQFPYGVGLAVGANNLFDEYPTYTPTTLNGATGSVGFPSYSPFGFNGRFLYARLSYSF